MKTYHIVEERIQLTKFPQDEDIDDEEEAMSNGDNECNGGGASNKFIVLADYMALTSREIDLSEDEVLITSSSYE